MWFSLSESATYRLAKKSRLRSLQFLLLKQQAIRVHWCSTGRFAAKHIPSFVSVLATVIRWIPKHPLMFQMARKTYPAFLFSVVAVSSSVVRKWTHLAMNGWQQPIMVDKLMSQSAVSISHLKTLHSLTSSVTLKTKSLGDVLFKWSKLLRQATLQYIKNGLNSHKYTHKNDHWALNFFLTQLETINNCPSNLLDVSWLTALDVVSFVAGHFYTKTNERVMPEKTK